MSTPRAIGSLLMSGLLIVGLSAVTTAQSEAPAASAAAAAPTGELRVLCTPEEPFCVAMVDAFAAETGIPFRVLLRAPFAALDLATAGLLLVAFAGSPWRLAIFAGYWLHPLAILFSAYHGNTDTSVAFFALPAA